MSFLILSFQAFSFLLSLLLLVNCYGSPSEKTVKSAINEAKRINAIKRSFNKLMKRAGGGSKFQGAGNKL